MNNIEILTAVKGAHIGIFDSSDGTELAIGDTVFVAPLNPEFSERLGWRYAKAKICFGAFETEERDPVLGVYLRLMDRGEFGELLNVFPFRRGKASIFHRGIGRISKTSRERRE